MIIIIIIIIMIFIRPSMYRIFDYKNSFIKTADLSKLGFSKKIPDLK